MIHRVGWKESGWAVEIHVSPGVIAKSAQQYELPTVSHSFVVVRVRE